jgi:hypothetical protein
VNARRKIIDPHRMELHFDRSTDFGSIVECFAQNKIGVSLANLTIPGLLPSSFFNIDLEKVLYYFMENNRVADS